MLVLQYSFSFFVVVVYATTTTAGGYYYRSSTLYIHVLTSLVGLLVRWFVGWLLFAYTACDVDLRRGFYVYYYYYSHTVPRRPSFACMSCVFAGRDRDRRNPPPPGRLINIIIAQNIPPGWLPVHHDTTTTTATTVGTHSSSSITSPSHPMATISEVLQTVQYAFRCAAGYSMIHPSMQERIIS